MQPSLEVARVIERVDISTYHIHQQKTLRAIQSCRTAALGGHVDACDSCGNITISYNSCRNRHCNKCQGHKRAEWISNREQELLPCTYYHVVFTVPEELNALVLRRPRDIYNALFESSWATLSQFGLREGVRLGMIAVLHTWGQSLSLHPHLHCIVPGGGVDAHGKWQKQLRSNKYLFSVKALSQVFRAKLTAILRDQGIADKALIDQLFQKDWVIYAKRPFGGPKQVIEYLGRYTHKVAITNQRLTEMTETEVSFRYKDYRKEGANKVMTIGHEEFVRRFAMHILPHRFVRIRHYGILSSTWKRGKLQALQEQTKMVIAEKATNTLLRKCKCCKVGNLITIDVFGSRGPPQQYLMEKRPEPVVVQ